MLIPKRKLRQVLFGWGGPKDTRILKQRASTESEAHQNLEADDDKERVICTFVGRRYVSKG